MKIYSCYTPSHQGLFEDHYRDSLPTALESRAYVVDVDGHGDFQSKSFLETINRKMRLVLESLDGNRGSVILWSDVDIVFLRDPAPTIDAMFDADPALDLAFQREHSTGTEVNAGFIAMRCNQRVREFYEAVIGAMNANPAWNEQAAMNHLLSGPCGVNWAHLPTAFFARSQGWPPPRDMILYHANCTVGAGGVEQKQKQFRDLAFIRRHRTAALVWFRATGAAGRILRRLKRLVSGMAGGARRRSASS